MIKLLVFDLDGVLVNSESLHLEAYRQTFEELPPNVLKIPLDDFAEYFKNSDRGLSADQVFKYILHLDQFTPDQLAKIKATKQYHTHRLINSSDYCPDYRILNIIKDIKAEYPDLLIYVASNSNWKTVNLTLSKMGYLPYLDYIITGSEVKHPKPAPDIYYACMTRANTSPNQTLIIEDSPTGIQAARTSGAHVLEVKDPTSWTKDQIIHFFEPFSSMDSS